MGFTNGQISYQKNNERTGNSKITNSQTLEPTANGNKNHQPASKSTETPHRLKNDDTSNNVHESKSARSFSPSNQNHRAVTRNKDFKSPTRLENYNVKKGNVFDSKGNIVQVNVHKTQIPAEPQKVKLNTNRQLTALSVQRREDNYKKISTSMLIDQTLQKGANFKERNAQIMSRVLDDMTNKVMDRRMKSSEYKKRDTASSYESTANLKRNVVSDSMKKYIGQDNMNVLNLSPPKEAPRIGSHEEDIEESNVPYALFYRMSPASLDNQEQFYLMKSMEDDGEKVFSPKEKRLSVNYQNEVDLKKLKSKKNYNTIKLRNKLKHITNFRSNTI